MGPHTKQGPGDDCAVIKPRMGEYLVSTDSLVEGVHFDTSLMSLKQIGYKAVTSNVSDIYAMNGNPLHMTVSLGISGKYTTHQIEELYSGINMGCKTHGVDVVGGDISSSFSGLVINITIIGFQKKDHIVYRSGAKQGDLIVVSGTLGDAYLGLQVLFRESGVLLDQEGNEGLMGDIKNQLTKNKALVERQVKPEARKDVIDFLRKKGVRPTSMIDVSDGLSSDLLHICKSSNVSVRVYENKIPISADAERFCREARLSPTIIALSGGEDYELLFTIKKTDLIKLSGAPNLSVIGNVLGPKSANKLILFGGEEVVLEKMGWDHFGSGQKHI